MKNCNVYICMSLVILFFIFLYYMSRHNIEYFEDSVVAEFGPDLVNLIVKKAKTFKAKESFLKDASIIDNMRALSIISVADLKEIYKADPIIKPSTLVMEKGMSLKTPAERKAPSVAFKKLDKTIVKEMARSSALLAKIWEQAYKELGSPYIKGYKSFKYPFTPDFVKPDYL